MKIQKKQDGTFVVDFNGLPFHVTPEYPTVEQYGEGLTYVYIMEHAKSHPEDVSDYIEPEFEMSTIPAEELESMRVAELELQAQKLLPAIQAGIDVEANQQRLVEIMLEIEMLKGNF